MKNIIYTGLFRFPTGDAAAARVLNNAKIFRKLGYNVMFISWGGEPEFNNNGSSSYDGFDYTVSRDIDIKDRNPLRKTYNHLFCGKRALEQIKKIKDIDIIIGYNTPYYFTQKILSFCNRNKTTYISDLTEWYAANEFPGGKILPFYWINEYNMKLVQKRVANKIVISSFLNKYYNNSHNIIIPPLVDSLDKKWGTTSKSKQILLPFMGTRLIYAGNPGKKDLFEKILNGILLSVKQGLQLQFIAIGIAIEDITAYEKASEILSFSNNFIFCGRVPQQDVPLYYKSADFSIIIRKRTRKNMAGFPTKLVESMMAGCPIITNSTSDIEEFIHNGYNGYLLPDISLSGIENVLLKVSKLSSQQTKDMKKAAYMSAIQKFDNSVYLGKLSSFMSQLK